MIIVDLIYNLTLLVALSVVSGFIDQRWNRRTQSGTVLQGALFGGAALIAMLRPLTLGPGLIFDGRSVVISLCGLFFGPLAAVLAGTLTISLRIILGGSGMIMGVLVISSSVLIGVFFHRRWQSRLFNFRAVQLWLFGLLVHAVMLALTFTLPDNTALSVLERIGLPVILTYPIATVLIGKILSDQESHGRFVLDLKQSEERFRTVADFTYAWEYWVAPDGQIIYMSPSCEDTTGYQAKDFQQTPDLLLSIVHPDDRLNMLAHIRAAHTQTTSVSALDFRLISRHGAERWIAHICQPVYRQTGEYLGRRVSNRNITERKQLEQALAIERDLLEQHVADRTRELAAANDRLQDLDRLKDKFVSDVSHELRTPVTSLLLYLDLLEHGKLEKRDHYLTSSIEQARRMQHLIENILDLSRLERDAARPVFEPIDLNAVLERVVLAQQPRAEAAGLPLILTAAPDLPTVQGDVNHLLQVMTNLIDNAINYTPAGAVYITSSAQPNCVSVEVRDTGLGIAPEDLPHLFERFYRGQRTRHVAGTGLGLAIISEIVKAHGGRLEVSSEVGAGSTFCVYLPVAQ